MDVKIRMSVGVAAVLYGAILGPAALGGVIGIDASHGYNASAVLATGTDFDTFRAAITSAGHTIVPKSTFNAADLVGLEALWLNQPYTQNLTGYSASEIAAIHAFVSNGGGLVVHGEGGTGSDPLVSNLNSLVAPYGVTYASSPSQGDGYTIVGFVAHPVTAGVSSIGIDYQRLLISISSPAIDLTTGTGADDALAVVNGVGGAGNVVFLSDTGIWSDAGAGSQRAITYADNLLLLDNIAAFVPEPATVLLLALASLAAVRRRR